MSCWKYIAGLVSVVMTGCAGPRHVAENFELNRDIYMPLIGVKQKEFDAPLHVYNQRYVEATSRFGEQQDDIVGGFDTGPDSATYIVNRLRGKKSDAYVIFCGPYKDQTEDVKELFRKAAASARNENSPRSMHEPELTTRNDQLYLIQDLDKNIKTTWLVDVRSGRLSSVLPSGKLGLSSDDMFEKKRAFLEKNSEYQKYVANHTIKDSLTR